MSEKLISQGAEAILIQQDDLLIKKRVKKSYRILEIDEKLRKLRTRTEARLLEKASSVISVPKVLSVSEQDKEIKMEFIDGLKLSQELDNFPIEKQKQICFKIGEEVSKLHDSGIIHSDLTTSNMILKEDKVYLIDFGLSFSSNKIEDKAVDLHLLRQALESKHFKYWLELFNQVIEGYKKYKEAEKVLKQLEKVEKRGRYKGH